METETKSEDAERFWSYFQNLLSVQDETMTGFAKEVGIAPSTPGKWKQYPPSADGARKVSEHFRRPVVEVYLKAGILKAEDLENRDIKVGDADPTTLSNSQLINEVARRLSSAADQPADVDDSVSDEETEAAAPATATRKGGGQHVRNRIRP